jgi:8-oxo-dGTP diphosphatase
LSELQTVYELILTEPLDKRNFRKRILALGVIEETGDERREGPHRPAKLYRMMDRERVDIIK